MGLDDHVVAELVRKRDELAEHVHAISGKLQIAIGYAEMLELEFETSDERLEKVREIVSSCSEAIDLIQAAQLIVGPKSS